MTLTTALKLPAAFKPLTGIGLGETLSYFRSAVAVNSALRFLGKKHPVVNQRFRYKRRTGYYRYIYAIDIVLLLAAGFTHNEIGEFYNTNRQSISFMASKLRQGGIYCQLPQRPKLESRSPFRNGQGQDRRQRLIKVIDGLKQGKYTTAQTLRWLFKQDEYYDRRFAKRHLLVGVGPEAERYLEWLMSQQPDGKVTISRVNTRRIKLWAPVA